MPSLLGMLVGGTLAVLLFSWLLEWAIFKRVLDTPETGITASVIMAALLGVVLYGFGSANGGAWKPFPGGFVYILGAVIVLPLRLRAYRRRAEAAESDELADTFR